MRHVIRPALWRVNFIRALQLVGQASARLPFGAPDPILHGSSAIELYTGGLWSAADLDLYTVEPGPLIVELFAMGFRRPERPRHVERGLWHPELHIGISIGSGGVPLGLAELSNLLTLIHDLDPEPQAQVSLRVIGIEDLIAKQVASCMMQRTPFSEAACLTRVLLALARQGVGGSFRAGYLQRRVMWDTDGAATLEVPLPRRTEEYDPTPRFSGLTHIQALIDSWRVRCGFAFDRPRSAGDCLWDEKATRTAWPHNEGRRRAGDTGAPVQNVIPFDAAWPVLSG